MPAFRRKFRSPVQRPVLVRLHIFQFLRNAQDASLRGFLAGGRFPQHSPLDVKRNVLIFKKKKPHIVQHSYRMSVLAVAHRVLVRVEALLERRSGEASVVLLGDLRADSGPVNNWLYQAFFFHWTIRFHSTVHFDALPTLFNAEGLLLIIVLLCCLRTAAITLACNYLTFSVLGLKILFNLEAFGKCLSTRERNLRPIFVATFWLNGGLNQISFRERVLRFALPCPFHRSSTLYTSLPLKLKERILRLVGW